MVKDKRLPGRPKDDDLDQKIIEATWALLKDRSLAHLTLKEIAEAAGTTRPAIYRRWNSVESIVIDAFLASVDTEVPTPLSANPAVALREYIVALVQFLNGRVGRVISEILGRAQNDKALMSTFRDKFLTPRRAHGRALILRGQAEGVFRADLDSETIIDLYAGPIYFRAFTRHAPLDADFAKSLANGILLGICV